MKTILIVLLCLPLGAIAWYETQRLKEVKEWPAPPPAVRPIAEAELKPITKAAEEVLKLPKSVVESAVRLEDPPEGPAATGPLAEAVLIQAHARAASRRTIEQARNKAVSAEETIKKLCEPLIGDDGRLRYRPDKFNERELEQELVAYGKLQVHDPDLLASYLAETAWAKDMEKRRPNLEALYDCLDQWQPSTPVTSLVDDKTITENIQAHRTYLNAHGRTKGAKAQALVEEARVGLTLWDSGRGVMNLLRKTADRRLEQIRGIVAVAEHEPPPRLEATARRLVQILCDDFLKIEPLDAFVLLVRDNQVVPEPRLRNEVWVRFKNDAVDKKLVDTVYDEYTLPRAQIANLRLPNGYIPLLPANQDIAPLKGTDYSNAIRDFNKARAEVDHWSEAELNRLKDVCEPNREQLSHGGAGASGLTLLKRIEDLREIVRGHANLFVAPSP